MPDDDRGRARRGLDHRRRRARGAARGPRLRLPPRDLPRQPELDGRPAGRPRAQHAHDAQALRALKDLPRLQKVVYASAGLHGRGEDVRRRRGDAPRTRRSRCDLDSPYQISKIVGELYANYYFSRHGLPIVKARFQNVYGPGEVLGAGRWRGTPAHGLAQRHPDVRLQGAQGRGAAASRTAASRPATSSTSTTSSRGLIALRASAATPGEVYNLASGVETSIRELAEPINELTGNPTPIELAPARDWDRSGQRYGDTGKARARARLRGARSALRDGPRADDRLDAREPRLIERCIARHAARVERPCTSCRLADGDRAASATVTVIEPPRGWSLPDLRELWTHRDLLYFLAPPRRRGPLQADGDRRSAGWSCSRVALALVFSVFLGLLAKVPSPGRARTRCSRCRGWCCGCSSRARSPRRRQHGRQR